ncbi:hypothetical protein ABEW47_02480 [Priestia megaterium]
MKGASRCIYTKQMIQMIEYRAICDQQSFDLANRYLSTLAN